MAIVDMGGGGEPAEGVGAHRFFRGDCLLFRNPALHRRAVRVMMK